MNKNESSLDTRPYKDEEEYQELNCDDLTQTEQRSLVFHLLYALESFDYEITLDALVDNFARGFNIIIPTTSPVFQKTQAIAADRAELDKLIIPLIENWRPERLGVATKLILRIALWELSYTDIDPAVIINEAVELAKCFAEKDAFKFINGLLDEYRKRSESTTSS